MAGVLGDVADVQLLIQRLRVDDYVVIQIINGLFDLMLNDLKVQCLHIFEQFLHFLEQAYASAASGIRFFLSVFGGVAGTHHFLATPPNFAKSANFLQLSLLFLAEESVEISEENVPRFL